MIDIVKSFRCNRPNNLREEYDFRLPEIANKPGTLLAAFYGIVRTGYDAPDPHDAEKKTRFYTISPR